MFGDLPTSLSDLVPKERTQPAQFFIKKNELAKHTMMLNELRVMWLTNPSSELEERIDGIQSTIIDPMTKSLSMDTFKLMQETIDFEGLKSFLPMILSGVLQYVNLPLVLGIAGIKPEDIKDLLGSIKDYLSSD